MAMAMTAMDVARTRARNRLAGWVIGAVAALIVLGGGVYSIWLTNTTPPAPPLPAGPPHAALLARDSETDMLQGNFVTQTELYRTPENPVQVIQYYRQLLAKVPGQVGDFLQQGDSILPSSAPEALQNMPSIFASPVAGNPDAANYFYTEYSSGQNDIGIAVDARSPQGPTLVYLEMFTGSDS